MLCFVLLITDLTEVRLPRREVAMPHFNFGRRRRIPLGQPPVAGPPLRFGNSPLERIVPK